MKLTDKQAKALDALRHGGTNADVRDRLGIPGEYSAGIIGRLVKRGYLGVSEGQPPRYTLTESGRAAWLASLK